MKVKITLTAEVEVNEEYYDDPTPEKIIETEKKLFSTDPLMFVDTFMLENQTLNLQIEEIKN